ncbi:MAG: KdsC family phosphatase [Planctomycetota bacterium]|jgi:YrbI family 3-deoxy-D-manno-octulosonate 8-phosphate phosphatase
MNKKDFNKKCRHIRVVITDVDGVLTDGGMYYSEHGDELKKFNVRDGVGVILMQLAGLKVGAFTGEATTLVIRRFEKIGIDFGQGSIKDKLGSLNNYLSENNYKPEQVAYIGDEINDYCLIGKVGLFFTVADANPVIKNKADFILETPGGHGVLREVAQLLLSAQDKLDYAFDLYIKKAQHNSDSE